MEEAQRKAAVAGLVDIQNDAARIHMRRVVERGLAEETARAAAE
ncbi:MAG TPA: hypothetical protein VGB82_24120 [Alphaproteobacteria bacterium]